MFCVFSVFSFLSCFYRNRQSDKQTADPQYWLDRYEKTHGNIEINSDEAKKLFKEYDIDPLAKVQGAHEASSIIAQLLFAKRLREIPEGSKARQTGPTMHVGD